jgi:RES domain-containing protein
MSCDIEAASPGGPVHRLGRSPDAWAWPDWAYAGPDGTFGNRYDDPKAEYRALYASSDRRGAFVEVLARFRPEPAVLRELDEIELEPGERDEGPRPGQLPRSWLAGRAVGSALADGPFAAVGASRSLAHLRDRLADRALHHGVDELDAAAIRAHAPRAFTQEVSRLVFECADTNSQPQFDGIAYRSRLGDEVVNWAIFEGPVGEARPRELESWPVDPDDPELATALELLSIELV